MESSTRDVGQLPHVRSEMDLTAGLKDAIFDEFAIQHKQEVPMPLKRPSEKTPLIFRNVLSHTMRPLNYGAGDEEAGIAGSASVWPISQAIPSRLIGFLACICGLKRWSTQYGHDAQRKDGKQWPVWWQIGRHVHPWAHVGSLLYQLFPITTAILCLLSWVQREGGHGDFVVLFTSIKFAFSVGFGIWYNSTRRLQLLYVESLTDTPRKREIMLSIACFGLWVGFSICHLLFDSFGPASLVGVPLIGDLGLSPRTLRSIDVGVKTFLNACFLTVCIQLLYVTTLLRWWLERLLLTIRREIVPLKLVIVLHHHIGFFVRGASNTWGKFVGFGGVTWIISLLVWIVFDICAEGGALRASTDSVFGFCVNVCLLILVLSAPAMVSARCHAAVRLSCYKVAEGYRGADEEMLVRWQGYMSHTELAFRVLGYTLSPTSISRWGWYFVTILLILLRLTGQVDIGQF